MNPPSAHSLADTVRWLAAPTRFPASRLEPRAGTLLCLAALAAADETGGRLNSSR